MLTSAVESLTSEFKVSALMRSFPSPASIAARKYPGVPAATVLPLRATIPTSEKPRRKGFFSASLAIGSIVIKPRVFAPYVSSRSFPPEAIRANAINDSALISPLATSKASGG
jgi:hypothetical protein